MRQNNLVMTMAITALVGGAVAGVAAWRVQAQEGPAHPRGAGRDAGRTTSPGGLARESGRAPPAWRLRAVVFRAWNDAIATWKRQMRFRAADVGMIRLSFVERLSPDKCYGLYAGEGPVYCSGNRTVFVGTKAANRLMSEFGPHAEAGITFLIGHEIGHHVQKLHGRFRRLRRMLARAPSSAPDLIRRFELEADCLAGVWVHNSRVWANSSRFRSDLLAAVNTLGDEKVMGRETRPAAPALAIHGTSEQRARWFSRGLKSGNLHACNSVLAANP